MQRKELSKAQRQHLERLMTTIKNAEADAQRFLGYCATEAGIEIGRDGWVFDLDEMAFKQENSAAQDAIVAEMLDTLAAARNGDLHG
jgi:tRNA/tmRNA/rRNA uracil-C5-methylase (TrmA/RlmC/RlmD family)